MVHFPGNILIIGCGAVGKCFLSLLFKHFEINPRQITILEAIDNRESIAEWIRAGVCFIQQKVSSDNMPILLSKYVRAKDTVIDLAYGINSCEMALWCHSHGAFYLGSYLVTSNHNDVSQYEDQVKLKKLIEYINYQGPTSVFQHGANPGLVSHFLKAGLIDLATKLLETGMGRKELETHLTEENFPLLAQAMDIQVIQITEYDTQSLKRPKEEGEFVSSFSVPAFCEEANGQPELSWGTHERRQIPNFWYFSDEIYSQVYLKQRGRDTRVKSWTPSGSMIARLIRHEEPFTIAEHLAIYRYNKLIYRPTVYFAYRPSEVALLSLEECDLNQGALHEKHTVMTDDISHGADELGILLMGHPLKSWWMGSILSIDDARKCVPNSNTTILQTAIPLIAALIWIFKNPNRGFNNPEDLPYKEILEITRPYLGKIVSCPVDWSPNNNNDWQFSSFLL